MVSEDIYFVKSLLFLFDNAKKICYRMIDNENHYQSYDSYVGRRIKLNTLDKIPVGSKVRVKNLKKESGVRRKLMDMGVVPGLEILVDGRAPLGDPIEILVRGYKLTLRKTEARDILVEDD